MGNGRRSNAKIPKGEKTDVDEDGRALGVNDHGSRPSVNRTSLVGQSKQANHR